MKKKVITCVSVLCLIYSTVIMAGAAAPTETDKLDLASISGECVDVAELIAEGRSDEVPEYVEVLSVSEVSEYDVLLNYKSQSEDILKKEGYSIKDIKNIKSGEIERELMARAQMEDEELYAMGYTEAGISILRDYDGSPIEENPQLRDAAATLNGSISKIASGSSTASAMFSFSWSQCPLVILAQVNDYITCGWVGTNVNNLGCTMHVSNTSCTVRYSDGDLRTFTVNVKDSLKWVQAPVLQASKSSDTGNYIKSGNLCVYVKEQVTVNKLAATEFCFHYGHSTVVLNGGVSIVPNKATPTFTAGIGVTEVWHNSKTIYS